MKNIKLSDEHIATIKVSLSVAEHEAQITVEQLKEITAILDGDCQTFSELEREAYERDCYLASDFYYDVLKFESTAFVLLTKWEYEKESVKQAMQQQYFRVPLPNGLEVEWNDGFYELEDPNINESELIKLLNEAGFERKEGLATAFRF